MATSAKRKSLSNLGTTPTVIGAYTAPAVATGVYITGLTVANTLLGPSIVVSVYIFDGVNTYYIVKNAVILQGGSINLFDEGARQVLNSNDQVFAVSNTAASCDVNMSVTEVN